MPESDVRAAYVHVPFCAHRCGYCDFALVADRADLIPKYLDALRLELQRAVDQEAAESHTENTPHGNDCRRQRLEPADQLGNTRTTNEWNQHGSE